MKKTFVAKIVDSSNIILTCEHGSRKIPKQYKQLGLSKSQLEAGKDWYDHGALQLTRRLISEFKCSFSYALFSRLLIDANRRLDANVQRQDTYYVNPLKQDLLVEFNDEETLIPIPGNRSVSSKKEEHDRWSNYVKPYLNSVTEQVQTLQKLHRTFFIFQIHSFFPTYAGDVRKIDIDVLSQKSKEGAQTLINSLENSSDLTIGDNQPWSMEAVDGGIFGKLQWNNPVELIAFDVNNKHLKTKDGIKQMTKLLARAIKTITEPKV